MKKLVNLNGAKTLSKKKQKTINGGGGEFCVRNSTCSTSQDCEFEYTCENGYCIGNS